MKALLSAQPGKARALRLEDVPEPCPAPGEVVIDVVACGVNFPDALVIEDLYQFRPERPFAPGAEVAGVVAAVGPGVESPSVGDRVLAGVGFGGMAEKVVAIADRCHPIPPTMPFDVAAAFLMAYGTSHHALRDRGRLERGNVVLILGAAGGVGLAAVELAVAYGARVIAAVSSREKADAALAHGAEAALVYPTGPLDTAAARQFSADIRHHAPNGVDIIYDAVGGDYAEPALRTMAWDGRYLVVGFPAGIPRIPLNLPLLKGCSIVGVFWGEFVNREPARFRRAIDEMIDLYLSGALRPRVSGHFPLARGGEAIERLAARQAIGKIVVTTDAWERLRDQEGKDHE